MTLTQKRAQASFKMRLLMHLAERKRRKGNQGFTLVELMIVVAIVGVLSAVALPQYLNAQRAAAAGARIGSAIGIAKECATAAASDIAFGVTSVAAATGITVTAVSNCVGGGTVVASFAAGAAGVKCLDTQTTATTTNATLSITDNGVTTCTVN